MAKPQKEVPMASVEQMRAAFHERMHANHMYGLWELASQMTPHPQPKMIPYMWKWSLLESIVRRVRRGRADRQRAARAAALQPRPRRPLGDDEQPDRRGADAAAGRGRARPPPHADGDPLHHRRHRRLHGRRRRARLHGAGRPRPDAELGLARPRQRHATSASSGWTASTSRLIQSLEAMFFQLYDAPQVPADQAGNNASQAAARPRAASSPTWVKEKPLSSPLLLYSWERTWRRSDALRDDAGSPYDGIALEYRHPQTGGSVLPTMACWMQMLRPGEHTQAHRQTGSAVYYVVEGDGETIIDGQRFVWGKGDIIAVPPWAAHEHANASTQKTRSCSRSRTRRCWRRWASTAKRP